MEIGEYEERSLFLLEQILAELKEIKASGHPHYHYYTYPTYPTYPSWMTTISGTYATRADGSWQKKEE